MVCHNAIIANLQFRIRYYDEVDVKRGKSGDLNQSYSRLGSFPKQDGRKTRDLSPRAVFDGGSDEPTILHLPSHVIDPLFSTLEAIILTGVNIYRETEKEGGKSERWSGRGEGGGQRKKEPRQYITPSAVRRGRPAKIAITPAESNEIKLHYLACHGAINHTPFSRPSPRRAPSTSVLRHRPPVGRSFRIPVYTCVCDAYVWYRSRCLCPKKVPTKTKRIPFGATYAIGHWLTRRKVVPWILRRRWRLWTKLSDALSHHEINCSTRTYLVLHILC